MLPYDEGYTDPDTLCQNSAVARTIDPNEDSAEASDQPSIRPLTLRSLRKLEQNDDATLAEKDKAIPSDVLYHYTKLARGKTTRLLSLRPGQLQDPLECNLMAVTSLEDFQYQALSYVWGKIPSTITESSMGKKIRITQNLEAPLRRIRDPDEARLLWVDAICIDQSNKAERSAQVEIMRSIYNSAQYVIIWLGEESEQDKHAFRSLESLKLRLERQGELRSLVRLGWFRDSRSGRVFSGGGVNSLDNIRYEDMLNLLCRDWFRRTWVIQEVASAQRAVVFCGKESMGWEAFAEVLMALGNHFLPVSPFGGDEAHNSLENNSAIENARRSRSGRLFMPLFYVLVATSFSQCTDQRDKIYAVKGLAKDWADRKDLETNYKIKTETLFKHFALADITQTRNLRALSCASGPSPAGTSSLGSWVPDWRNLENAHPFVRYSNRTKFCASGGMAVEAWQSHYGRILHVKGKAVDCVARLGSIPAFAKTVAIFEITPAKIQELQRSAAWLKECEEFASDKKDGQLSGQRRDELWRSLTCNLTGDGFPAPERYAEYFSRYMDCVTGAADLFNDYLNDAQTTVSGIRGLDEVIPGGHERHSIIEESIARWSSKRRFGITSDGALGCFPKGSLKGDIICVLFGGEVPYVLRPAWGGLHWVVGECYVHGIMHGEGLSHDTGVKEFQLV